MSRRLTIRDLCESGRRAARLIQTIKAGGYPAARAHFDEVHSDGRTAHGAARRAAARSADLPATIEPYIVKDGALFVLDAAATLDAGRPIHFLGYRAGIAPVVAARRIRKEYNR